MYSVDSTECDDVSVPMIYMAFVWSYINMNGSFLTSIYLHNIKSPVLLRYRALSLLCVV